MKKNLVQSYVKNINLINKIILTYAFYKNNILYGRALSVHVQCNYVTFISARNILFL
jgi:hypothetical protein